MNIEEIIADLKSQLQVLEDAKIELTEVQENIRESICQLEMAKESLK